MKIQITLTCNGNDMYRQTQIVVRFYNLLVSSILYLPKIKLRETLSRRQNHEFKYQLVLIEIAEEIRRFGICPIVTFLLHKFIFIV